jgi:hypothetical protein
MISKITDKELNVIKEDYRSKVLFFSALFGSVMVIAFVISGLANTPGKGMLPSGLISFSICFAIVYFQTKNHRLDLKFKNAITESAIVQNKKYKMDYEPGSVLRPFKRISIFSFRKTELSEMKEMPLYSITVNDEKYFIEKELFYKIKKGDNVIVRTAEHTKVFLDFEVIV